MPRLRIVRGDTKNSRGRRLLDLPALVQEHDVVGEALGLREVVRAHHDRRAARVDVAHDVFHRARGLGVEARRRLVEEQHFRPQRPRAREREPLLLAARQHARRAVGERAQGPRRRALPRCAPPLRRRECRRGRGHTGCWRRPSGAGARRAGRPWPVPEARVAARPSDRALRRRDEAVQQAQQRALAGAVGPEHRRERARARS